MEESASTEISIRQVPSKRRYWFVRTFGGQLFEYYYDREKIGISGNTVPMEYIKNAKYDSSTFSTLQSFISKNIIEIQSEATKLANQLVSFYHEMQIGDIVMIPSEDSDYIAFGEVVSDIKVEKSGAILIHNERKEPYPEKIRKVRWLKIMDKFDVVGDMRPLFSSHLGLTNADKYSDFIESNISTFFLKDDHYFSTLYIDLNNDQELNAFELQRYLEALTKLYKNFCLENGIEENEELYIKIKVQSPGSLILKWSAIGIGISFIGMIAMSVIGVDPQVKIKGNPKEGFEFSASVKGNFLNNIADSKKKEQEIENQRVKDSLDIEDRKLDQKIKRKQHGLLTAEEVELYKKQMVDSASRLKMSTVESKEVSLQDVN